MFAASVPGFAEVQNVRVGGNVTWRGIGQSNTDLEQNTVGQAQDTNSAYFHQLTTGVNVGADLTENVSAFARLANERTLGTSGTDNGDFDISQAWVKFKELFYSPLTVTLGTQPIWWGRGLVLGSNLHRSLLDSTTSGTGDDRNNSIDANQFTEFTAFDAARFQLDLDGAAAVDMPLNAEYVFIKSAEGGSGIGDDVNIHGVKLGTNLDDMNTEVEAYWLLLRDESNALITTGQAANNRGSVHTIGLRGSSQPGENSLLFAEAAYQFGDQVTDLDAGPGQLLGGEHAAAWLFNLGGELSLGDDASMSPKLGAEWIYTSGDDLDGAFSGWQPVAPGYFPTLIRAYQTRTGIGGLYPVTQGGVTSAFTNQHELALYGGLKPMEDLGLDARLAFFLSDVAIRQPGNVVNGDRDNYLGTEIDTWLTYNYTEDVQFGLSYGVFFPGSAFVEGSSNATGGRSTAQQLVSTVSVKF
jgi:hypothetical protein